MTAIDYSSNYQPSFDQIQPLGLSPPIKQRFSRKSINFAVKMAFRGLQLKDLNNIVEGSSESAHPAVKPVYKTHCEAERLTRKHRYKNIWQAHNTHKHVAMTITVLC